MVFRLDGWKELVSPDPFLARQFIFAEYGTSSSDARILLCRNPGAGPLCFMTSVKSDNHVVVTVAKTPHAHKLLFSFLLSELN